MDRSAFTERRYAVPPRSERASAQAEWRDALVVVEGGAIELEAINDLRGPYVS